jgi:hypothetical protein
VKITKRQLRRIVKEELLRERREASVSDIVHHEGAIRQWVEKLLDDIGSRRAIKVKEMDDKRRRRVVDQLVRAVSTALISTLGSGSSSAPFGTSPSPSPQPKYSRHGY